MPTFPSAMLPIAAVMAVLLEIAVLAALAYGALRFAAKFLRLVRDVEEIKRELRNRSSER